jgi:hypothetical protein
MNEYVTKFTQPTHYALHEEDTDEKKHECFSNGLNDGLTHALEAKDFDDFQGMVNKALVLENRRGVMECKHKLVCCNTHFLQIIKFCQISSALGCISK